MLGADIALKKHICYSQVFLIVGFGTYFPGSDGAVIRSGDNCGTSLIKINRKYNTLQTEMFKIGG